MAIDYGLEANQGRRESWNQGFPTGITPVSRHSDWIAPGAHVSWKFDSERTGQHLKKNALRQEELKMSAYG